MVKCCAKYNARDLRETVAIQSETRTTNGSGGFSSAWATISGAPTRAMIEAAPGSERWGFMRQVPGNGYRMVTRWFDGATAASKVIWDSGEYAVLGVVDPDGGRRWLEWRLSDGAAS